MADAKPNEAGQGASGTAQAPPGPGAKPTGDHGTTSVEDPDRRTALRVLVGVGAVAYAGALAIPAVRFATSTRPEGTGSGSARWLRVARLADLPEGEPRRLQIVGDQRDAFTVTKDQTLGSVWVTRSGESVKALSAACPHLGCSIDLNADKKSYSCPCHASRFSLEGKPEAGPSPRAMDPLEARIVDGWVEIDFRRFVIGITERKLA